MRVRGDLRDREGDLLRPARPGEDVAVPLVDRDPPPEVRQAATAVPIKPSSPATDKRAKAVITISLIACGSLRAR